MLVDLNEYITDSNHFLWKEALWLPSLRVYHSPTQEEVNNIIETCKRLDKFRDYINLPFRIHCFIRPGFVNDETGQHNGVDYNALVGGASHSAHKDGKAVDFDIHGLDQDQAMKLIGPKLVEFEMSAENNTLANGRHWCHLDSLQRHNLWCIFNP